MTSLIQIASSFVQAGVGRARMRRSRHQRRGFGADFKDEPDDDRNLDVYLSFDRKDLGVTVFTNSIVREKLCPTLLRTFHAVDIVEGFDADRDDSFSKFSAKSQIIELLLRLWAHPSGECRDSVASLPSSEILSFASSLTTVTAVDLDFALGALEKIRMTDKEVRIQQLRGINQAMVVQSTSQAVGMLLGVRRSLILLCAMSEDEKIASYLGGYGFMETEDKGFICGLSNTFIHFLEKLTSLDGGTNPDLEETDCEPTSNISSRLGALSSADKAKFSEDVIRRRIRAKKEYGLDVSILCHQLLALAARWHLAAVKATEDRARVSALLAGVVKNEDCDLRRIENVFRRLVIVPEQVEDSGSEANAALILEHDGYVDSTNWEQKYIDANVSEVQKQSRQRARQDQVKHSDILKVAGNADIELFLDDLRSALSGKEATTKTSFDHRELARMQESILNGGKSVPDDTYTDTLTEWVVSSAPFKTGKNGTAFAHSYDKVAKSREYVSSAKNLVKEARKCHKTLPVPTANSAIFVCFAEERMDLCRVIVSGPVDTPYAHGLFEFDVYFSPTYPNVPPLVTFMTTGECSKVRI